MKQTIIDVLQRPYLIYPIMFLLSLVAANLLMNIKHADSTEKIDACSSRFSIIELVSGYGKLNNCPKYVEAKVEKWGFPLTEKIRYTAPGYSTLIVQCRSIGLGLELESSLSNKETYTDKCPSYARKDYRRPPQFLLWINMWILFVSQLILYRVVFWKKIMNFPYRSY